MESKSLDMRDQLISLQNGTGTYELQGTYDAFTPKASINLKIPNRLSMEDTPFSKLSRGSMDSNGPTQRTPVRYSKRSNSPINYNAVTQNLTHDLIALRKVEYTIKSFRAWKKFVSLSQSATFKKKLIRQHRVTRYLRTIFDAFVKYSRKSLIKQDNLVLARHAYCRRLVARAFCAFKKRIMTELEIHEVIRYNNIILIRKALHGFHSVVKQSRKFEYIVERHLRKTTKRSKAFYLK